MDDSIILISFDINSTHEENNQDKNKANESLVESPQRIFEEFFSNHKQIQMDKKKLNESETKYIFSLNMPDMSSFQIIAINDLSFIHEIALDADAYIIFINLEDPKTEEKLEYLIRYIVEGCCSVETKTCVVGLYKDKILPGYNKEELENLFNDNNLIFEYFQVKYTENEKQHNCLNKMIENKNNFDKNLMEKNNSELKMNEAIEKILLSVYENKFGVEYNMIKNKFIKKGSKAGNDANSLCNII
jgi:hypothetical protein